MPAPVKRIPFRTGLVVASLALGGMGCRTTAPAEPFDLEAKESAGIEALPRAVGGALGTAGRSINQFLQAVTRAEPAYLDHARKLNDPEADADERREALLALASYEFGQQEPYTDAYRVFARRAQEPLTRAAAIRAINLARDEESVGLVVEALSDESVFVRLEAAKALGNLPNANAATELLERAMDSGEDLDVRLAAIDALRPYDDPTTKRSLAELLESSEFSLVWQARYTLIHITGEDHGFDVNAWRRAIG